MYRFLLVNMLREREYLGILKYPDYGEKGVILFMWNMVTVGLE